MAVNPKLTELLNFAYAATTPQIARYLDTSTRYTNTMLKRLHGRGEVHCIGRASQARGGRPFSVWALPGRISDRRRDRSILLSLLYAETLSFSPMSYYPPDEAETISLFESQGMSWTFQVFKTLVAVDEHITLTLFVENQDDVKNLHRLTLTSVAEGYHLQIMALSEYAETARKIANLVYDPAEPFFQEKRTKAGWMEFLNGLTVEHEPYRNMILKAVKKKQSETEFSVQPTRLPTAKPFFEVLPVGIFRFSPEP